MHWCMNDNEKPKDNGRKSKSENKLDKSMYAEKKSGQKEQKVEAKDGKWEGSGGRNWEDNEWIIMAFLCEELEWVQSNVNNITVISLMSFCCTMIKIVQNGCMDQVIDWRIQTWMQRDPRFLDFRQSFLLNPLNESWNSPLQSQWFKIHCGCVHRQNYKNLCLCPNNTGSNCTLRTE